MAVVHHNKSKLAVRMNLFRLAVILCVLLMLAVTALVAYVYICHSGELLKLGDEWHAAYTAGVVQPWQDRDPGSEAWQVSLHNAAAVCLTGAEAAVRLAPMVIPAMVGIIVLSILLRLAHWLHGCFSRIKVVVDEERSAVRMARMLPKDCHAFINQRICCDDESVEMDLILAGPGGVAVAEIRNVAGRISGRVADEELSCVTGRRVTEKIANPAKLVSEHAARLRSCLHAAELDVWVAPCAVFIHPHAEVKLLGAARELFPNVGKTVVAEEEEFYDRIGRAIETGEVYDTAMVQKIAGVIGKAVKK